MRASRAFAVAVVASSSLLVGACSQDGSRPTSSPSSPSTASPSASSSPSRGAPASSSPGTAPNPSSTPLTGATTVTGRSSTVTGTVDRATLTSYAAMADRAIAQVSARWDRAWSRRVTVIAPRDIAGFRELVGRADDLSQVAAITTGPVDGTGAATDDRVILNPVAFAKLTPAGRQFVITHESTHVAVRGSLPGAAPLWLVEGFADHVGYAGSGRSRAELAAPLLSTVAEGAGPTRLPQESDFDSQQGEIAPTYLAAWLAVDLIARTHGEAQLEAFYVASTVSGSPADAETATDRAFAAVLKTDRATFTRQWLAELRRLAAAAS